MAAADDVSRLLRELADSGLPLSKTQKILRLFERSTRKPSDPILPSDTWPVLFSELMAKRKRRPKVPKIEWRSGPEGAAEVRIYQLVNRHGIIKKDYVRHNLGVCTQEEAEEKRAVLLAQAGKGKPIAIITVEEFIEQFYLPGYVGTVLSPSTLRAYTSTLRIHVIPAYGKKQLRELSTPDIQRLIDVNAAHVGHSQLDHIRAYTSGFLEEAIRLGFIDFNPARHVKLPRQFSTKEQPTLTEEQFAKLLDVLADPEFESSVQTIYQERNAPLFAMLNVGSVTGIHYAELAGLRWRRVNLTANDAMADGKNLPRYSVAIRENYVRGHFGPTKNRGRNRIDALTTDAVEMLLVHKARSRFTGPDDLVFCCSDGQPLNEDAARRKLTKALKQAGVTHVGFHAFRRYYATESERDQRQTVTDRQRALGHSSSLMTALYSTEDIERRRVGAEKISASLAEARRKLAENMGHDQAMTKETVSE